MGAAGDQTDHGDGTPGAMIGGCQSGELGFRAAGLQAGDEMEDATFRTFQAGEIGLKKAAEFGHTRADSRQDERFDG